MTMLFLSVCSAAIAAGWVVLGVMLLRLLLYLPGLRRVPRTCVCLLWAVVGLRLVVPSSLESAWSLLPHAEPLTEALLYDPTPTVHTGVPVLNTVINEAVMPTVTPNPGDSCGPLQVLTAVGAWVWVTGAVCCVRKFIFRIIWMRRRAHTSFPMNGRICPAVIM